MRRRVATGLASAFLTVTGSAAEAEIPELDAGGTIFSWEPAPVRADAGGRGHALFRSILEDPHFDSESFWERDRRWTEEHGRSNEPVQLPQSSGFLPDVRVSDWMGIPELSFAFAPLALGGGLLLLRRRKEDPWLATG
jgi:hypothetical protein